ncbi:F-actin-monooxygenase mical1 [Periophthalmus magnuspinnatus]|uniref:F-actin-monooxygenase mical1 n=1 Tax=Periophthalmus magnuspinnatus TaxID=409849 RepID=UPI00145AFC39|nr:F-actin-monooxygenase mical1 [Periophthalmus magnuspinnatus]
MDESESNPSHAAFELFTQAQTFKEVQHHFSELCKHLEINPKDYKTFYRTLKDKLNSWKAKAMWTKFDKRASHPDYQQGKVCAKNKCLVLGAGPCGLRTAIELSLLGAQVVVIEKRETFSRNNVLHLWPYTIIDLRNLCAKKFYGKFCTGALDHVSIRQLQLILLKVALLLGVEVHSGVEYQGLVEPTGENGWMAQIKPASHPVSSYQFDVFISAAGGSLRPEGFKSKELRGKLAIGITANFVNRHTAAEAQVAEISGVARIYNQKFFQDLHTQTGIDLENIVYYKDDTHYFVMTAKKKSLLKKGVIKQDCADAEDLLARSNVDYDALCRYAHDAADFSTGGKLPDLEFAQNHQGKKDVAMFDFTCMHRAENASMVRERKGKKLLIALVGDCLMEPFWPLGTGIARGFLAAFDTAWMVRSWGLGTPHLKILAERESVYQLLSQTTPENTSKNYATYSINPKTRYQRVNLTIQAHQVQNLYDTDKGGSLNNKVKNKHNPMRQDSMSGFEELLRWCQKHTAGYKNVHVTDFTESWRSGLALCALIHHFRPKLIDMSSLSESEPVLNHHLAFSLLEKELGVPRVMSPEDFTSRAQVDKLSMVLYLTQVQKAFTVPPKAADPVALHPSPKLLTLSQTQSAVFFLSKLKHNSLQRQKEKLASQKKSTLRDKKMGDEVKVMSGPTEPLPDPEPSPASPSLPGPVPKSIPASPPGLPLDPGSPVDSGSLAPSGECYFCGQRVYVLERISAEGLFFHRSCFKCNQCGITLRLGGYTYDQATGRFSCELHSEDLVTSALTPCPVINEHKDPKTEENHLSSDSTPSPSDEEYEHTLDCGPSRQSLKDPEILKTDDLTEPTPIFRNLSLKINTAGHVERETAFPVPKPRLSKQNPQTPVARPRTIHFCGSSGNSDPSSPAKDAKQSLKKLQLTDEEKSQLVNLQNFFSADSDSETPCGSSSCSSSSATVTKSQEEEGYWSGSTASNFREKRNRRCFKRKEIPGGQAKSRSKFSPWNLSSPRISRDGKLSVLSHPGTVETTFRHTHCASENDADDDEDEDEMYQRDDLDLFNEKFQCLPSDPVEAQKLELMKMRTLERRAKMSELQRLRKAQSIQRRLEEIEVTYKDLEEKGVELERTLRREDDSSSDTIEHWIQLVHEKNALVSEESELMVASRQLELEDKQSMLELELRKYFEITDKSPEQAAEEERILQQMLEVVDMRDSLVSFLEEKRLKELSEEQEAFTIMEAKRHSKISAQVNWE